MITFKESLNFIIMKSNTYLHFNGNCEEAMAFYADVLGAETTMQMRFNEAPPEVRNTLPDFAQNLIMHCTIETGDFILMASDFLNEKETFNSGNNFAVSINTSNEEEAVTIFNGLAENGFVVMPLDAAFWGGKFGMLRDQFGVNWMLTLNNESHLI